jgi:hypothetical protein
MKSGGLGQGDAARSGISLTNDPIEQWAARFLAGDNGREDGATSEVAVLLMVGST